MESMEQTGTMNRNRQPFDWSDFLDLGTISSVIHGAEGEFRKLLDAAEFALSINPKCLEKEVLGIVLHVISRMGVYDHALVGRMLDVLFEAEGHFFSLFADALMSGEDISEGDVSSAEYFLSIGSRKWYRLGDGNKVRFVDVPIMSLTIAGIALRRGRPAALRTFLRHGADPEAALEALAGTRWNPRRLTIGRRRSLELIAAASARRPGALAALLPIPLGPRPLKHSCKVVIRRCLAGAGCLPLGISALRLPSELHRYLDLETS